MFTHLDCPVVFFYGSPDHLAGRSVPGKFYCSLIGFNLRPPLRQDTTPDKEIQAGNSPHEKLSHLSVQRLVACSYLQPSMISTLSSEPSCACSFQLGIRTQEQTANQWNTSGHLSGRL